MKNINWYIIITYFKMYKTKIHRDAKRYEVELPDISSSRVEDFNLSFSVIKKLSRLKKIRKDIADFIT